MILHLCHDEKVITRTIHYFEEALPNNNRFIILLQRKDQEPFYVKVRKANVYYERYNTKSFWDVVGDIKQYDHIIYHCLWPDLCRFTLSIPKGSPITWIVWGTDLYVDLLEKRNYRLYAYPEDVKIFSPKRKRRNFILYTYFYLKEKIKFYIRLKAIQRVKNICACEGDLQLLYEFFPEVKPYSKKSFFYYPVDDIIGSYLREKRCTGNNIIVGNSASFTNNHRYVFEKLKNISIGSRKVIVPLSYGIGKDAALEAGKVLKGNFYPVLEFLPLKEYNEILASVRTFIYGHFRQEAFGNIVIAFYLGGTVFLDEKNPLLYDLRKDGYIVFTLDQLSTKIDYKLTESEYIHNRDLVLKKNNRDLMLSYIRKSFGINE